MATTPSDRRSRTLSYSEINTALTCFARHAFAYTGHLTSGDTLKPRELAPILGDGRAWGAAVAAFHADGESTDQLVIERWARAMGAARGREALVASLYASADEITQAGAYVDPERLVDRTDDLGAIFAHYALTTEMLPGLTRVEGEINVPIPARTGSRSSSRYRYHCFIDGHAEHGGHPWIVEFKLRSSLTPVELIEKQPQYRWYAWARRQELKWPGAIGVYVDERWREFPKPARIVQAKRKSEGVDGLTVSHAQDQLTTPELYRAACLVYEAEPQQATIEALRARRWQQRVPLVFTPDQLDEAGRELVSAAQMIRDLDSGVLWPIRHASRANCGGCAYRAICIDPANDFMVTSLFERTVPKRLRGQEVAV